MSEIHFSDNHNDLSTDTGFQFEFYCENCRDAWRSPFDRYATGTLENVLGAADGLLGGLFGRAREAVGHMRSAGWQQARDTALRAAVTKAKEHFHRCPRCSNHHCDKCWNADEGTCISCVPRLDAELASIRREAKLQKAREVAFQKAEVGDEDLKERAVSCPECEAPVGRGKFCPECGAAVSLNVKCGDCDAEMPKSAKFCPECGAKNAAAARR
ncbi:zinc ribbon domain-containing protein [Myxococcaceae bacterium GXIMD 01537]